MSDDVTPALTADEWAEVAEDREWWSQRVSDAVRRFSNWFDATHNTPRPHAVAALALHGQPFGFTREDVALLERLAIYAVEAMPEQGTRPDDDATPYLQAAIDATALTFRIAAFLPPEPKG